MPTAASTRDWIVAYDIHSKRSRRYVASLLEGSAQRAQKSVFTTQCTQHEMVGLLQQIEREVDAGDRIVCWPVILHSPVPALHKAQHRSLRVPDYWIA
jgi:CRISPR-associated endonuclease Cas2